MRVTRHVSIEMSLEVFLWKVPCRNIFWRRSGIKPCLVVSSDYALANGNDGAGSHVILTLLNGPLYYELTFLNRFNIGARQSGLLTVFEFDA